MIKGVLTEQIRAAKRTKKLAWHALADATLNVKNVCPAALGSKDQQSTSGRPRATIERATAEHKAEPQAIINSYGVKPYRLGAPW